MITGADAITQMRKLDEIISAIRGIPFDMPYYIDDLDFVDDDDDDTNTVTRNRFAEEVADTLEQWRDEIIKAGGIKPLESYTELLAPGDKF